MHLPLVFACSGCSPAGRLAYDVALELQRRGIAEMSCLAGVGAAKPHFLKQLTNREVWVIDGCPIECALGIFGQQSRRANVHIRLHDLGVKKATGAPEGMDMEQMIQAVLQQVNAQSTTAIAHSERRPAASQPPYMPSTFARIPVAAANGASAT